jgi:hypothetical protein
MMNKQIKRVFKVKNLPLVIVVPIIVVLVEVKYGIRNASMVCAIFAGIAIDIQLMGLLYSYLRRETKSYLQACTLTLCSLVIVIICYLCFGLQIAILPILVSLITLTVMVIFNR